MFLRLRTLFHVELEEKKKEQKKKSKEQSTIMIEK